MTKNSQRRWGKQRNDLNKKKHPVNKNTMFASSLFFSDHYFWNPSDFFGGGVEGMLQNMPSSAKGTLAT